MLLKKGNTKSISFHLEEVFGSEVEIENILELSRDPDKIEDEDVRDIVTELEDGLLKNLHKAIIDNKAVQFDLKYVFDAIRTALPAQKAQKDGQKRKKT